MWGNARPLMQNYEVYWMVWSSSNGKVTVR
ncbi:hypothetical protein Gogos_003479 [Gossypium gossypioides]|uniref:Uncharacterized protein n=1 Tax=Gossypium gossypioides TaxID=34282 RepID=A0A7J9CMH9_GOSGO|nr:hypothetical protein [Gossypium gossypioides]